MKIGNGIIEITSTGNVVDSEIKIINIQAIASADNSVCVLTDNNGFEIARFVSALTNERMLSPVYLGGKVVNGINCDIFTNMTKVIIHTI